MGKRILISRTDSIGDVILTLPLCAWLKQKFPQSRIFFLGKNYTLPVLRCFPAIDEIIDWDDLQTKPFSKQLELLKEYNLDAILHVFPRKEIARLAQKAKISMRIGTSHRLFHLTTCNYRMNFTRKNSDFHEAQLNFELLRPFGLETLPTLVKIKNLLSVFQSNFTLKGALKEEISRPEKKAILHPKSNGSAVEWPIEKYIELSVALVKKGYRVYFTGTEREGQKFRELLPSNEHVIDLTGKCSLDELIAFIAQCDVLVACSTGPLHIAAVSGICAIGLYADVRPIHPGRWMPLGKNSHVVLAPTKNPPKKEDIYNIKVSDVLSEIEKNNK